ncbi:DUF488 domain-containing protein [bacterium]|nr:DUF488 domain-containing protein [bacterium]
MTIALKRAYEAPAPEDGDRFLVDRLWPRGVTKEHLKLSAWLKDLGPSTELRRWFGHKPERWREFEARYRDELSSKAEALSPLLAAARHGHITLVYGAKDTEHNQAVVLKRVIEEHLKARR